MQFFAPSHATTSSSKLPAFSASRPRQAAPGTPELRGCFESSLDLAQGLEVTEHDCATLYDLWRLARQ